MVISKKWKLSTDDGNVQVIEVWTNIDNEYWG